MSKLDINRLRSLQAMSLGAKVARTRNKIAEWVEHWGEDCVYVAYSGGKDSTVLLHVARELYPSIPAVFVDTGLEYPEVRGMALAADGVVVLRPKMTFSQVLKKYGYPVVSKRVADYIGRCQRASSPEVLRRHLRGQNSDGTDSPSSKIPDKWQPLIDSGICVSDKCCDVMKKRPMKEYCKNTNRKGVVGVMADESRSRAMDWMRDGCNAFDNEEPLSRPLAFWTEQDVLQYLRENNIAIPSVYGEQRQRLDETWTLTGCQRTGCMFCMFGVHMEEGENRFQRMYRTHHKQWKYCMDNLGCRKVLEYIGVKCGDEVDQQLDMFNNTKEATT